MKIFMATMGLGIGGAETHIVELAKELKARGHEVVIASNGGVYVDEVEAAGIRHYAVPMHRRSVGDMLRSRTLLRRILREERPDIVHAHARIPAFLCGTLQRELGQRERQSANCVFALLGSGAVRGHAFGLHADAAIDWRCRDLVHRDAIRSLCGACKFCHCIRGGDIGGSAAFKTGQAVRTGLVQFAGIYAVHDALFAINDGVFTVRREAHDRHFAAVFEIPYHILTAGFLIRAEQDADAAGRGKASILQRSQRV